MEEYKPNSKLSKAAANDEKKVEKVTTGTVKTKKKSEFQRVVDAFVSEEASNVKNDLLMDVFIPAVKKMLYDMVTTGMDKIFYGRNGSGKSASGGTRTNYVSYSNKDYGPRVADVNRGRAGYLFDDIIFDNRGDAEGVLSRMDEIVDTYGMVSVADLYEMAGVSGRYTDCNYGWTNIRSATVDRVRDGYIIRLPRAIALK